MPEIVLKPSKTPKVTFKHPKVRYHKPKFKHKKCHPSNAEQELLLTAKRGKFVTKWHRFFLKLIKLLRWM